MLLDELGKAPVRNSVIRQALASGRAIPDRLIKEMPPAVHPSWQLYLDCFWAVCSDRMQGSRIRWTAVQLWCEAHGLSGMWAEDMHFIVNRLDMAYIDWAQTKTKQETKKRNKTK